MNNEQQIPMPEPRALPVTYEECRERGWHNVDIVLVGGDAYVDHPSFGIALIGRLLSHHGYRVAMLPQPRFDTADDFMRFGRPRLFFGISAGNLDSIVANYTGNGTVRDHDAYSPKGTPWRCAERSRTNRFRPDRAVLRYASLAKSAYPGVTIIIGGVEASLRRFIHYDYKQERLRGSHLTDSKADLLIYGMGERAVVDAAARIAAKKSLEGIAGSCRRLTDGEVVRLRQECRSATVSLLELPGWQAIQDDIGLFMEAEKRIDHHSRSRSSTILLQRQQAAWVVQYPPARPLEQAELDSLYHLDYTRRPHRLTPDIPAFDMIKDSITIMRGCPGNCSFCAISRHQGPTPVSRSIESLVAETRLLASTTGFSGTVSDLGGPTANLFGTSCRIGSCTAHDCLYPQICKNLLIDETRFLALLDRVTEIAGVEHVFISSGMRLELLLKTPKLLEKIVRDHIPGNLKIAPEHTEKEVLNLMHKESFEQLRRFLAHFHKLCRRFGTRTGISPYIISAHPGCSERHIEAMVKKLKKLNLTIRQFQDFTPTPGTLSTAMYVTSIHRDTGERISVPKTHAERLKQRRVIERAFFLSPRKTEQAKHHSASPAVPRKKRRGKKKFTNRS